MVGLQRADAADSRDACDKLRRKTRWHTRGLKEAGRKGRGGTGTYTKIKQTEQLFLYLGNAGM